MRTTLTLDDDVAALLERLRDRRGMTLKTVVNDALRIGLTQLDEDERPDRPRRRTRAVSLGGTRLADVDDVAEVLALTEGEGFR